MILKNEAERIERCLTAVAPHVHCWAITDTGSTDQTCEMVLDFFSARGLPGHLGNSEFTNFRDTRNVALDMAYKLRGDLAWDYLLLCDADMELVAPDGLGSLGAPGYQMIQRTAEMEYWNARLVRYDNPSRYVCPTHEYLSTEQPLENLHQAHFVDHADGANRPGKILRDIAILETELEKNPDDARCWFYLANSYRESEQHEKAIAAYERRVALGGWEEEVYCSLLYASRSARAMGG
jgi:tetratricopeptide (TPR) repeat protein